MELGESAVTVTLPDPDISIGLGWRVLVFS